MKQRGSILVTGGAGYIGSHVVLALVEADWPVVVLDDLSTGRRDLVAAEATFVEGNVGDAGAVADLIKQHDCVAALHFAGSIIVPESVSDPLTYYLNNAAASMLLIDTCVRAGIKAFVFSSTAAVYGNPDTAPVSESAPLQPINPYGVSKLMIEWVLRDTSAATDLRFAALRYFNVAGADPDGRSGQAGLQSSHLIKTACEAAIGKRTEVEIFGEDYDTADGTCVRDFIHVSDLANAHVLAMEDLLATGENLILNCGYGHGYSVRQVVETLNRLLDEPISIVSGARRAGDAEELISDSAEIRQRLNWQPRHDDLETILRTALAWERKLERLQVA